MLSLTSFARSLGINHIVAVKAAFHTSILNGDKSSRILRFHRPYDDFWKRNGAEEHSQFYVFDVNNMIASEAAPRGGHKGRKLRKRAEKARVAASTERRCFELLETNNARRGMKADRFGRFSARYLERLIKGSPAHQVQHAAGPIQAPIPTCSESGLTLPPS